MPASFSPSLVAPCGIDCALCRNNIHFRAGKPCPGCRGGDANKSPTCINCRIKNCSKLLANHYTYCYECGEFPCFLITRLDKRYRAKYGTSVIDNLRTIHRVGIDAFIAADLRKWTCPSCNSRLSMHLPQCPACGVAWRRMPEF